MRACAPTMVLMPFGLANPDHDVTHQAALVVRERIPDPAWLCYEDTGYKHIPGMLAWRVAQLFRRGLWPTPVAVPIDAGRDAKAAAVSCYRSQLLALEADWQHRPEARRLAGAVLAARTAPAGLGGPRARIDQGSSDGGRSRGDVTAGTPRPRILHARCSKSCDRPGSGAPGNMGG